MIKCSICGKPIKNKKSIERGIGPTCWRKRYLKPLMNLTAIFDQGPRTNNDTNPPLHHYLDKVTIWQCGNCKADLHKGDVHHYRHSGGVPLRGWYDPQWIYIRCPKCSYGWSLWKLYKPPIAEIIA